MSRPLVDVRECIEADLPAMVRMWEEMRAVNNRIARNGPVPTLAAAEAMLAGVRSQPNQRLVVALIDGELAGMACLSHQPFVPLYDVGAVMVTYLHVSSDFRRRGVGHALVAAAVAYADEVNAEQLVASVTPNLREPNRFFARLGFSPVVVNRTTSVAALRRRLAADMHQRPVQDLLALRRSLRSRVRKWGDPADPLRELPSELPIPEPAAGRPGSLGPI